MKIVGVCTFYCNGDDHDVVAHLVCGCEYLNDAFIPCPEHGGENGKVERPGHTAHS